MPRLIRVTNREVYRRANAVISEAIEVLRQGKLEELAVMLEGVIMVLEPKRRRGNERPGDVSIKLVGGKVKEPQTYCSAQVSGGFLGHHRCNNVVPIGEKFCSNCKPKAQIADGPAHRRVSARCEVCGKDFATIDELTQHDKKALQEHRRIQQGRAVRRE